MTLTNRKKDAVQFDPARHFYHFTQYEVDMKGCGVAIARLKSDPNMCEWVKTRSLNQEELTRLPQLDTTAIEPIEVSMLLKLNVSTWEEVKTEQKRAFRRTLRRISKAVRMNKPALDRQEE